MFSRSYILIFCNSLGFKHAYYIIFFFEIGHSYYIVSLSAIIAFLFGTVNQKLNYETDLKRKTLGVILNLTHKSH